MIQMRTMLTVADNSGAKKLQAIRQAGGSTAGRYARLGDIVTCAVKEAAPDSQVKKGTGLVIMEAMKMEHTLAAAADGVIASVNVAPGYQVEAGAALVVFEVKKDEA